MYNSHGATCRLASLLDQTATVEVPAYPGGSGACVKKCGPSCARACGHDAKVRNKRINSILRSELYYTGHGLGSDLASSTNRMPSLQETRLDISGSKCALCLHSLALIVLEVHAVRKIAPITNYAMPDQATKLLKEP